MNFLFEKKVKSRAIETFIVMLILTSLMGAGACYMIFVETNPVVQIFGEILGGLALLVGIIMLVWCLNLAFRKGGWVVQVSDGRVSWQTPLGSGESSFSLAVEEIDRIICERSSAVEFQSAYSLITKDGRNFFLKPSRSGINIENFIESLRSHGVRYETK